jgi:hypothetical protein
MCDPSKPLSDRHKDFVDIYIQNGKNATKAYEAVYGTKEGNSAGSAGQRLLKGVEKHPYFVEKCAELEKSFGVSFEWAVKMNKEILEDAMRGDDIPTESGFYTKKERMAALKAVKQITDLFGWDAATKQKLEVSGQGKNGEIELTHRQLTKSQTTAISIVDELAQEEDNASTD